MSTIVLRPKTDGSFCMILNLKQFNESVEYHHFKMDTLETVTRMTKPGCFMASVDLKDAYYTVSIHSDHQKYLKFMFNGTLYQYMCLPNGLSSAPRILQNCLSQFTQLCTRAIWAQDILMTHTCKETQWRNVNKISQTLLACLVGWGFISTPANQCSPPPIF